MKTVLTFLGFVCAHKWGWPLTIKDEDGKKQPCYQRCVMCGAEREFDAEKWEAA